MTAVATAIAGSAILGAVVSSDSSRHAANTQADAAAQANDEAAREYDQSRADLQPYRDQGGLALNRLSAALQLPGSPAGYSMNDMLSADPGYQFRLQQGQQALDRSAAARGGLLSGRALKDTNDYAQGQASQEFGNAWNRLAGLAGIGQTATNTGAQLGQGYATTVGNNLTGAANARASGYVGAGNAVTGALGQGINAYQTNNLINTLGKTGSNGASAYSLSDVF